MPATKPVTFDIILADYAAPIAFVAEETPATSPDEFIDQLAVASERFADAGINGAGDLDSAATYLTDAWHHSHNEHEQAVLLARAGEHLRYVRDMRDEYELML